MRCAGRFVSAPCSIAAAPRPRSAAFPTKLPDRPIGVADGYSAAIAATRTFAVVTHDMRPFEAAGLRTVNPCTAVPARGGHTCPSRPSCAYHSYSAPTPRLVRPSLPASPLSLIRRVTSKSTPTAVSAGLAPAFTPTLTRSEM